MTAPPTSPAQQTLARVMAVAALDGWSVIVIAGLSLLVTLLAGQLVGLFVSGCVLAGGIIELRGRRRLKRGDASGMRLLVRAQQLILAVILVYCARSAASFDAEYLKTEVIPEVNQMMQAFLGAGLNELLDGSGLTTDELVPLARRAFFLTYGAVAVVTLIYQGGLALYYRRRIELVQAALAAPPPLR